MKRHEIKYIINPLQKKLLINKLKSLCTMDSNCIPSTGYKVSSLYFDDYNNSSYYDKINGIENRKKFRLRAYNDNKMKINLEKKIKRGNICEKQIFPITYSEYLNILSGKLNFLKLYNSPVAKDFYFSYTSKGLRPKSAVSYNREAYIYKYGNVRITFDSQIKSFIKGLDIFSNYLESELPQNKDIILEVKYEKYIPSNIKAIIQNSSTMPIAISKYTNTRIV